MEIEGPEEVVLVVAPVGWLESDENMESENMEPVVVVFGKVRELDGPLLGVLLVANEEATLAISVPPALSAPELNPNPFIALNEPVG